MIGGRPRPVVGAPSARPRLGSGGGAAFAVAVLVVASAVGLHRIDRPAYWVDEATTVMLVRWRWTNLIDAIGGPEAPLGPYYLLMKPWTSVSAASGGSACRARWRWRGRSPSPRCGSAAGWGRSPRWPGW